MKVLDLFSGIGGFSLAARWMGWETVQFVELDKFCQKVLQKNFPNVPIHGDIKTFDGTRFRGAIDILTGGFPCQPFSTAGKRKGTKDDRYLWPEMLRVIREVQPASVVGENVYGLLSLERGLVFEQVCADLENEGYQVQPVILPACAVNAPHRRDRVWIVAHAAIDDDRGRQRQIHQAHGGQNGQMLSAPVGAGEGLCGEGVTTNTNGTGISVNKSRIDGHVDGNDSGEVQRREAVKGRYCATSEDGTITDSNQFGLERRNTQAEGECTTIRNDWSQFPIESPLRPGNDGLSPGLARSSIQAGGNAIVPQIAFEIFKAIEQVR